MSVDDDGVPTPPVRAPSAETALQWAAECEADATKLAIVEVSAREMGREFRALAEMFRAWEHGTTNTDLRSRAYAHLFDLRQRARDLNR